MIIVMICLIIFILLFVIGWYMCIFIIVVSIIIGIFLSIGLIELIIYMIDGKGIKYEMMNFLLLLLKDIFLVLVLIGLFGVIMDVVIIIVSGMYEIL